MKNLKKWIASPIATVILFAGAAGLLLFSTVGAARAVPQIQSEYYQGHLDLNHIGVTLLEKSAQDSGAAEVGKRDYIEDSADQWNTTVDDENRNGKLLTSLLGENEEFLPGHTYTEEISVKNSGGIDQYVRVTIYKYWTNASGEKVFASDGNNEKGSSTPGLAPSLIHLEETNQVSNGSSSEGWIKDPMESSETEERMVYYYNKILAEGDTTPILTSTLTVDELVEQKVTQTTVETDSSGKKTIRTSYDYDGWQFCIEAEVDAVQDHNAEDAIRSAWGRKVTVQSDGTLSLDTDN